MMYRKIDEGIPGFFITVVVVIVVACLALLLSGCASHRGPKSQDEAKPGEVFTSVSPPLGLGNVAFILRVVIPKPTPEMYCPGVDIEVWGEPLCEAGSLTLPCSEVGRPQDRTMVRRSEQESDCDPFGPDTGPFFFTYRGRLGVGGWEFVIRVKQGQQEIQRSHTVTVR
jgi:hypothetical protein